MRILILDDDNKRHAYYKEVYKDHQRTHVLTSKEAIAQLEREFFHVIHLDHDLGELPSQYSNQGTGYEVVCWLEELYFLDPECRKPLVVIHSLNPTGALKMERALKDKIPVVRIPYKDERVKQIAAQNLTCP